jgi:hypothetical protein
MMKADGPLLPLFLELFLLFLIREGIEGKEKIRNSHAIHNDVRMEYRTAYRIVGITGRVHGMSHGISHWVCTG